MSNKKKIQMAVLGVILVAVIAGGVWFLRGSTGGGEGTPENLPDTANTEDTPSGTEAAGPFDLSAMKSMHYSLQQKEEDLAVSPYGMTNNATILSYEGQLCQLTYKPGETAGDFTVDVVSMPDGETLHSFPGEDFPVSYDFQDSYGQVELGDNFMALTLDENGGLWAFYLFWGDTWEESDFEALIAPCTPDAAEEDIVALGVVSDQWYNMIKFLVRDGRAFLVYDGFQFSIVDLSDGSYFNPAGEQPVQDFCLDENGNLYYVWGMTLDRVDKYSLEEGKTVWTKEISFGSLIRKISYTAPGGLFISDETKPYGKIYWLDPEAKDIEEGYYELINFGLDLDNPPEYLPVDPYSDFVVDDQFRIYASYYYFDFSSEETFESVRYTYLLEPEIREESPQGDMVTLTITSPYKVESVADAIHAYQQSHPEVEVVWDTQYISREEFQKNALEYRDQITLRTMTGEVGDLMMILGSGLGQETITDTDAFLDLSSYLENCSFQEELGWNMIETLRGEDGAIRAVPLAARAIGYIWNMSLLEELGSPVDPDTATWSELLDLALQWQEEGADLSLMAMMPGSSQSMEDTLLTEMLLANLYSAEQVDGTVQLDQPYLRELLTKWGQLHGSTQLVDMDGDGLNEKTLLSYTLIGCDAAVDLLIASEEAGNQVYVTTLPKGEVNQKQQGRAPCWGIPTSSKNRDAAWDLLQYLISAEGLPVYEYSSDTLVMNTAAQENWFAYQNRVKWGKDGTTEIARKYFDQICALQTVPYNRLDEPYGWVAAVFEPVKAYIDGEMTLDQALETANANWERFVLE